MSVRRGPALAAMLLATLAASGCGLKGALTLPTHSDEVVIRAPGQAAAPTAEPTSEPTAEPTTTSAEPVPTTPTAPAAPAKKPAKDERIPPPPLPGGNPGTARGG